MSLQKKLYYFKAGNFYKRNMLGMAVAELVALLAIVAVPSVLKVLRYTKQSTTPCICFVRYFQTILHMHALYTCDPSDPNCKFYKTLNVVRWKHTMSSKKSKHAGVGGIYQREMALTQLTLVGYVFMAKESLGLRMTPREKEAFNHCWRVLGYMLGIPDRLNLCRKTAEETHELCEKLFADVITKHLREAPPEFYHMASAILNGLWYMNISLDANALLHLTYRLTGIECKAQLGWYSWLNMKYHDWIFHLCLVPYIGAVVRVPYNYLLIVIYHITEKWPVLAWIRFGMKNIKLSLYPTYKTK